MDSQNPPTSSHGQQQQRAAQPVYDTNHGGHYGTFSAASSLLIAANSNSACASTIIGSLANLPEQVLVLQYVQLNRAHLISANKMNSSRAKDMLPLLTSIPVHGQMYELPTFLLDAEQGN
jgi:hypothetical protein